MDEESVHRASAALRFAEGLRRRSEEARAEATIREAAGLALLQGARVSPAELREFTAGSDPEALAAQPAPDMAAALGCWRATWRVIDSLGPLNPPPGFRSAARPVPWRQMLSAVQRDYASFTVPAGLTDPAAVNLPRNPDRLAALLRLLETESGSALKRASFAWALFAIEKPFHAASELMGTLAAKRILANAGVEPTGVSVLAAAAVERQGEYRDALAAAGGGQWEPWQEFFAGAVVRGCEVGQKIVREVQAGRPGRG